MRQCEVMEGAVRSHEAWSGYWWAKTRALAGSASDRDRHAERTHHRPLHRHNSQKSSGTYRSISSLAFAYIDVARTWSRAAQEGWQAIPSPLFTWVFAHPLAGSWFNSCWQGSWFNVNIGHTHRKLGPVQKHTRVHRLGPAFLYAVFASRLLSPVMTCGS